MVEIVFVGKWVYFIECWICICDIISLNVLFVFYIVMNVVYFVCFKKCVDLSYVVDKLK